MPPIFSGKTFISEKFLSRYSFDIYSNIYSRDAERMVSETNPWRTKATLLLPVSSWIVLLSACLLEVLFAPLSTRAADINQVDGYHLRQVSEEAGPLEAIIAGDFCRYDNSANATSYIVNAKSGEITVLNHKRKQYWVTPYQQFSPALSYLNKMIRFNDYMDLKQVDTVSGSMYNLPTKISKLQNPQKFTGTASSKFEKLTVISGQLTGCPKLSQDKNMVLPVSKFLSIPVGHDYPLEFTYVNRKGGVHKILSTRLVDKVKVRPDSFKPPPDYRPAKNQSEVYLDSAGHDTLEDMLR